MRKLVQLSMEAEDGDPLGSEADLLQSLEISRPTLRQAAKIVQNDQLLEVRRGAAGGFYARRPDVRHVVQGPAFFLRLEGANLQELREVTRLLVPLLGRAAAQCTDQELRETLAGILAELDAQPAGDYPTAILINLERRLSAAIAEMCGNPFVRLFVGISYEFGMLERNLRFFERSEQRRQTWRSLQQELSRSVLDGDTDNAERVQDRRSQLIEEWLEEDVPATARIVRTGRARPGRAS